MELEPSSEKGTVTTRDRNRRTPTVELSMQVGGLVGKQHCQRGVETTRPQTTPTILGNEPNLPHSEEAKASQGDASTGSQMLAQQL